MDSRCCGLVLICTREKVPLKGISVDVQVKGFVADVSATLKYKNLEEKPIEAVFVFSMDDDSAVYSFEATVEGQTIVADLQEEKQAHMHYDHYMSQGQQAFLLEEDENSRDVFKCYVGNLLPGQEAEVTLCYVQELPVEADGAVRFVLPAILNPRYTPEGEALNVTATHPRVPVGQIPYTLSLDAHFQSAFGISKIESNCDLTPLDYTDTDKTSAKVSLSEGHKFEQDVELLAYYADANKPSATMELGDSGAKEGSFMAHHVVMLNFNPSFPEAEEQCTCGEFIFLMDRSGSMQEQMNSKPNSPQRIQSAKDTLILLLKSLPLGSYFNVFSFGSGFQSFFPKSVEYTQKSMEKAWRKVKEMEANFGGTEILEPLNHIYKTRSRPGHPRQLFVFTDGEVGNTRSVIEAVQKNAKNHRCFTFGIGEGASTALLKGMARAGNGTADFITSNDRMQPKVLRALKHAIQPIVEDVALKWSLPPDLDSDLLSEIPHAIFQGQRCILYAQVKGKMDFPATGSVSLEYRYKDEVFQNVLPLSFDAGKAERPTIHRLAAKTLISELEDRDFSDSEATKKRILETSLQSGVISSLTAFLAVNKDTTQLVDCDPLRWDIPSTVSYCYEAIDCCLFVDNMDDFPPCQMAPPPPPILPRRSRFSRLVASIRRQCSLKKDSANADCDTGSPEALESSFLRLISLQNADGSWRLSSGFSVILGIAERDLKRKKPQQGVDNSVWATLLAVIRLHASYSGQRDEWELLERKALSWLKHKAGTSLGELVKAGNELLASSVNLKVFGL